MALRKMSGLTATAASAFTALTLIAASPAHSQGIDAQIEVDTPSAPQVNKTPEPTDVIILDPANDSEPSDSVEEPSVVHYTLDDIKQFIWNPDEEWTIDVYEGITAETGTNTVTKLFEMARKNPDHDIVMRINSPGGSANAGLEILDAMHAIPNNVHTLCSGMVASMGAYICMGNSSGEAVVTPGLMTMNHNTRIILPPQRGPIPITDADMEAIRTQTEILKGLMCGSTDALADNPRRCDVIGSIFSSEDFWATPEELKTVGLIDHILYPENFNHNGKKSGLDILCNRDEPRAISLCNALHAQEEADNQEKPDNQEEPDNQRNVSPPMLELA